MAAELSQEEVDALLGDDEPAGQAPSDAEAAELLFDAPAPVANDESDAAAAAPADRAPAAAPKRAMAQESFSTDDIEAMLADDASNGAGASGEADAAAEAAAAAAAGPAAEPEAAVANRDATEVAKMHADAAEANKRRAERFAIPFVKPNKSRMFSRTEARSLDQPVSTFVTGIDFDSAEEQARKAQRAARFGIQVVSDTELRAEQQGLDALGVQEEVRKADRSARFGVASEADRQRALAASEALVNDLVLEGVPAAAPAGEIRQNALHIRAPQYLWASTQDLIAFFEGYGVARIEWLNGFSVNAVFNDSISAGRAFKYLCVPIPTVPGIAKVNPVWKMTTKQLVKKKSDTYGVAGAVTDLYVRFATTEDCKEKVAPSRGPSFFMGYLQGQRPLPKVRQPRQQRPDPLAETERGEKRERSARDEARLKKLSDMPIGRAGYDERKSDHEDSDDGDDAGSGHATSASKRRRVRGESAGVTMDEFESLAAATVASGEPSEPSEPVAVAADVVPVSDEPSVPVEVVEDS